MVERLSPTESLERAIVALGSQVATAKLLGITQGAISKWISAGRPLPAEHVLKVEKATGISRHELRPDLYPLEPTRPERFPGDMEPAR